MELKQVKALLQANFKSLAKEATHLFEVNVDKDQLWALYLDSFPPGTNEMYRERREFDCSSCRNFIRNIGNVVCIQNNQLKTIWDFDTNNATFQPVIDALDSFIKAQAVTDVYVSKLTKIGTDKNFEHFASGEIVEWNHFYLELPSKYVSTSTNSEAEVRGEYRDTRNVFKRGLDELTEDSLLTVLELIAQKSLYKGDEWTAVLRSFLQHKKTYEQLPTANQKDLYTWAQSVKISKAIARLKNTSMGTLLTDLSQNIDLDTAVGKFEKMVAGENYKRPKPLYSKQMLSKAQAFATENNYIDSLERRHATLEDITVNNILFSNKDAAKRIAGANVFEEMSQTIAVNPRKFTKIEEVTIEHFLQHVLPITNELELLLENKHCNNMVSLIAPVKPESKIMFKWENPFSWAYAGNITDSSMKANVKAAGGHVDGVLRFSIQWNDEQFNGNDFDAHCIEPNGYEIYYGNKGHLSPTGGMLDVDIVSPKKETPAVENITWENKSQLEKGTYQFFVHNFSHNGGRTGFKAEIEFDGEIFTFEHDKELRQGERVYVAEVYYDGNNFSINKELSSTVTSKEIWNVQTNQFIPVTVAMYSPNYWDEQQGIGHKHYFFMLKDCVNPESPNGFYNEFLKEDFGEHKRVMEALGSKMAVALVDEQLSGVGFSSTKRNEVIVKVKGQSERMLKIKF